MAIQVNKVEVWAGEIPDQPGGLANLLDPLAEAGANLECVIARRQPEKPGTGVVFLTPVKGKKVQDAARSVGMSPAKEIATLRIEGTDQPGAAAQITRAITDAGISFRGVSGLVLGKTYVAYIGFDSTDDATRAARIIRSLKTPAPKRASSKRAW